jgi:hypothetical protein
VPLPQISALEWNQDEEYGGFGGPHCMVVGGYGAIFARIAALLDVRLKTPVVEVGEGVWSSLECGLAWPL